MLHTTGCRCRSSGPHPTPPWADPASAAAERRLGGDVERGAGDVRAARHPLVVGPARAELGRAGVGQHRKIALSPSERQVAELATSGMTNRNIAATMFISPKTVESNLARIYAKLGIHSRAELGRHIGRIRRIGKHPIPQRSIPVSVESMTVPVPCYLVEWYHSAIAEEPLDDTVGAAERVRGSDVRTGVTGPASQFARRAHRRGALRRLHRRLGEHGRQTCDRAGIPAQRVTTADRGRFCCGCGSAATGRRRSSTASMPGILPIPSWLSGNFEYPGALE